MTTWFHPLGRAALSMAMAATLAACGGDGNGGGVRVFFGANGSGSCDEIVVTLDLDAAGAVLEKDDEGALQCALDELLADDGCDIDFDESEDGSELVITITGCEIPEIASLFECIFEDVDTSELQQAAEAQCDCAEPGCEEFPPLCVNEDGDPGACEICDNGDDDDDNGDIDCEDANCRYAPECQETTTTTLEPTTTTTIVIDTTTTTTTSSSTTTLGPIEQIPCEITFRLEDAVTVGSLQWDTGYASASGEIDGSGDTASCTSLVSGALAAFNDNETTSVLGTGLIALAGFTGPTNLAVCDFSAIGAPPAKEDFVISNVEATDAELNELDTPSVVISSIECVVPETTTTTLGDTTTTTSADTTTTTVTDVTTTTIVEEGGSYSVVYKLDTAAAAVGSLQFDSLYTSAPGVFRGSNDAVSCTNNVTGALFAPNDVDAQDKLSLGWIALAGFSAPTNLATCIFDADGAEAPVPGDFPVSNVAATDTVFNDITVSISVTVTPIP